MQWKNQLTRLEEASKREIRDWKEQYLRAEQERSRLSSRIDELVAEQLQVCLVWMIRSCPSHINKNATQTPRPSAWISEPAQPPMSKQTSTARKPRPSIPASLSDSDNEEPILPLRRLKSKQNTSHTATDRERTYVEPAPEKEAAREGPSSRPKKRPNAVVPPRAPPTPRASVSRTAHHGVSPPRPQLIRRVHAVIEVPVKEEVYSDEENALASDDSEWRPQKSPTKQRRRSSIKSKPYVEIDEQDEEDEDDDDQLLIGAEVNIVPYMCNKTDK